MGKYEDTALIIFITSFKKIDRRYWLDTTINRSKQTLLNYRFEIPRYFNNICNNIIGKYECNTYDNSITKIDRQYWLDKLNALS